MLSLQQQKNAHFLGFPKPAKDQHRMQLCVKGYSNHKFLPLHVRTVKQSAFLCTSDCLPMDPKHPNRWRRLVQCEKEPLDETSRIFKDTLMDLCDQTQTDWSNEVLLRLQAVAT